jgi:hypothetical protein
MRAIAVLIAGAAIASCTTASLAPTDAGRTAQQYQRLLAGKVAQPPVSCLPAYRADDMTVLDANTIAFRQSGSRVYLAHMKGGCSELARPGYALLTRQYGTNQLCRGDIAQVIDTANRMTVGSCVFGDFTPYVKPGS